jgi:hypothetical protein
MGGMGKGLETGEIEGEDRKIEENGRFIVDGIEREKRRLGFGWGLAKWK